MTPVRYVRSPVVRIFDHKNTTTLIGIDGVVRAFPQESAPLARAVLDFITAPRTRDEVLAHVASLTGRPLENPAIVDELLALLLTAGVVREAGDAPRAASLLPRTRLVLGVSGAIAAAYTPSLVDLLQRQGFEVRVLLTENARRFVSAAALEAMVHDRIAENVWDGVPGRPAPHIELAEWAQVMLVCPAAASTLSRIATGDFDELVAAVALTTRAPVVLVPSMNPQMYAAPSVQRNLETLRDDGFHVVHPAYGHEVAHAPQARVPVLGPAPPPDAVLAIVRAVLLPQHEGPSAIDWEALWTKGDPTKVPWHSDRADEDLLAALATYAPPPARLLDVGTGLGVLAVEAKQRGYQVVATDLSSAVLAHAKQRAGENGEGILWLRDDVRDTRVHGTFSVVVDRGCFHLLDPRSHIAYVQAVRAWLAPGGILVLKTHSAAEPTARGTMRFTESGLSAIFTGDFEIVSIRESTMPGPDGAGPKSLLAVFRRRTDKT